jgi:hypothetical protein
MNQGVGCLLLLDDWFLEIGIRLQSYGHVSSTARQLAKEPLSTSIIDSLVALLPSCCVFLPFYDFIFLFLCGFFVLFPFVSTK